jgi:uncharacterized membrane protein
MKSSETYVSIQLRKSQARTVWLITSAVVAIWVGLILAAPIFESSSIYHFFSYICHQIPQRSLHLAGHQLAACTRCSGVYFGLLAGILAYPLWRAIDEVEPIPRFWLFLSLIPMVVDVSINALGIWENTHLSRIITGLILGFACATFIVPALVEITRNFTAKPKQAQ